MPTKLLGLNQSEKTKLRRRVQMAAHRCSYQIFLNRYNKEWKSRNPLSIE
jgi:hypothetical protein